MFFGIANTYRENDGVDITTRVDGRPVVVAALDIETLGETVRRRVKDNSGVDLEWEIKRIGVPA